MAANVSVVARNRNPGSEAKRAVGAHLDRLRRGGRIHHMNARLAIGDIHMTPADGEPLRVALRKRETA